jgi:drug/metabolite transporter (DMT)-like permease
MTGPSFWFPAKRYGWGWGPPVVWQGWLVLVVYVLLAALGMVLFRLPAALAAYLLYLAVITTAFIGVCYWKGEPPKWRWGGD